MTSSANEVLEAFEAAAPEVVAVDTETEGFAYHDPAFCATLAWDDGPGSFLELDVHGKAAVSEIMAQTPTWVFHNAKFDLHKLLQAGVIDREDVRADRLHDTEAIAHLLDENRPKGLKDLAKSELGLETDEAEAIRKNAREKGLKKKDGYGYHQLDRSVVIPYAIKDAEFTYQLFHLLYPRLLAIGDEALMELYRREMRLSVVLLDMERAGLGVDVPYLRQQIRDVGRALVAAELEIRPYTGGEPFVDHHARITAAFEAAGVDIPNAQKETLKRLDHPLAKAIQEYRRLKKLHSTYLLAMEREQRDGILHPNFRQHGTRTGRMSSGGNDDS